MEGHILRRYIPEHGNIQNTLEYLHPNIPFTCDYNDCKHSKTLEYHNIPFTCDYNKCISIFKVVIQPAIATYL
jgi:hypothetical protein